jgi:hypothetical protein
MITVIFYQLLYMGGITSFPAPCHETAARRLGGITCATREVSAPDSCSCATWKEGGPDSRLGAAVQHLELERLTAGQEQLYNTLIWSA